MKIFSIVGARPQFIKAAVIARAFQAYPQHSHAIIHSGQHYDSMMSDVFFTEMNIPMPKINLDIHGGGHGDMTGRMLIKFEELFNIEPPDLIVVYGDTNTTLAASLAAKKLKIKIAHVEAGVRNGDMFMPEEINRVLVDRLADFNFCCTEHAVDNLKLEGIGGDQRILVQNVGDVMYDAFLFYGRISVNHSFETQFKDIKKGLILVTLHRPFNVDNLQRLENILLGLNEISEDYNLIFPVHPRTRQNIEKIPLEIKFDLINPVGYFEMLSIIKTSEFIITDSGGVVREAYFDNKMSLYLLNEHVWPEIEKVGASLCLIVNNKDDLTEAFRAKRDVKLVSSLNLFGEGRSGDLIVSTILNNDFNRS